MEMNRRRKRKFIIDHKLNMISLSQSQSRCRKLSIAYNCHPSKPGNFAVLPRQCQIEPHRLGPFIDSKTIATGYPLD